MITMLQVDDKKVRQMNKSKVRAENYSEFINRAEIFSEKLPKKFVLVFCLNNLHGALQGFWEKRSGANCAKLNFAACIMSLCAVESDLNLSVNQLDPRLRM